MLRLKVIHVGKRVGRLVAEPFPTMEANFQLHYNDVGMSAMASQITSITIVYSTLSSCTDQRKDQRSRRWLLWGEFTGDDIFKCVSSNENKMFDSIQISFKLVVNRPVNNKTALVKTMVWWRTGDKPLSETMMAMFIDVFVLRRY